MKKQELLSNTSMIFTVIVWGLSFLSIKVVIDIIPPMTLGLVRFIIASVFLFAVLKFKEPNTKVNKKDLPLMAIAGFIGVTVYFFFENNGIKLMPASTASLIIATIPIFTFIFESIVFKTKLTKWKILSVFISFIGVFFIVNINFKEITSSSSFLGYLFMIGAVLAWVVYSLVTKPLFGKYSQLTIVFYQSVFGTIFFIPFSLFESTNLTMISPAIIFNVLYLGVFCSAIGYITYVYSMEHLGVSTSSLYLNILPLVTVIASYFILDEKISLPQIIGGLLIVLSVYIVGYDDKKNLESNIALENIQKELLGNIK